MHAVDWSIYQTLLDARGERPQPRLAYVDGLLEIMTTSRRHEIIKKMIARLAETYVDECGGFLDATGQETLKHDKEEAGVEPDEAYFVGPMKAFPDLVIEVVQSHGGIDKLEIYRRMKVGEVWFWLDDAVVVYRLVGERYQRASKSAALPGIDLEQITEIVGNTEIDQAQAVRDYRAALRRRAAPRKRSIRKRRRS